MKTASLFVATVLAAALPAAATAAPAQRFLQDAVAGDNGEVANGRMAQQQGASRGVKDFGRTCSSRWTCSAGTERHKARA